MKPQVQAKSLRLLFKLPHKNTAGFTLHEILIVLILWSVLILCIFPLQHSTFQDVHSNHFLKQFKADILLTQQLTMESHINYWLMFRSHTNDYILYDGEQKKVVIRRQFPEKWRFQMLTIQSPIRFNSNGTIRNPGTMKIYGYDKIYTITFPFGASRVYIEGE